LSSRETGIGILLRAVLVVSIEATIGSVEAGGAIPAVLSLWVEA